MRKQISRLAARFSPGTVKRIGLAVCFLMFAFAAVAQEEDQDISPPPPPPEQTEAEDVLPQIDAFAQTVTTPNLRALASALQGEEKSEGASADDQANALTPVGDLDGDGVAEAVLKWALPEPGAEVEATAGSGPLWGLFLLSWDGTHWTASRLANGVEDFTIVPINLGKPGGRALAVVPLEGATKVAYPAVFQVRDHAAMLMWDAHADDSRYEPLVPGRVSFEDRGNGPAEMVVVGKADPGLLQFDRNGHRGFTARTVYHWDGKAYIPAKAEYIPDQDYTLYRFISALHLHDFRSAYALIAPAQLLHTESPTLDGFRDFIQDKWPEFLADNVFTAPESFAGRPDDFTFALQVDDKQYVYHPIFSIDGKFLLIGLQRTEEAVPPPPMLPEGSEK